jgi:hypothetical protein
MRRSTRERNGQITIWDAGREHGPEVLRHEHTAIHPTAKKSAFRNTPSIECAAVNIYRVLFLKDQVFWSCLPAA